MMHDKELSSNMEMQYRPYYIFYMKNKISDIHPFSIPVYFSCILNKNIRYKYGMDTFLSKCPTHFKKITPSPKLKENVFQIKLPDTPTLLKNVRQRNNFQ